jgi:hypothetical protein
MFCSRQAASPATSEGWITSSRNLHLMSAGSARKRSPAPAHPECPLCLGRRHPSTVEDYLPQWLRKADLTARPVPAGEQLPEKFKTRICKKCNAHLGKKFENPAAPLLKPVVGSDATLTWDADDQATIAHWFIKTNLMYAFACLPKDDREFVRKALLDFMYALNIDGYWSIRVGAMNPVIGKLDSDAVAPTAENVEHLIPAVLPATAHAGIEGVGWLQAEVIYVRDEASFHKFIADTPDSDWWIRLWPVVAQKIHWPPGQRLSFLDVLRMKQVWRTSVQSAVTVGAMHFMEPSGKHFAVRTGVEPA